MKNYLETQEHWLYVICSRHFSLNKFVTYFVRIKQISDVPRAEALPHRRL
jgi:hypothetical protein